MTIPEAIEKAIKGGFLKEQSPRIEDGTNIGCANGDFLCKADIVLSPDFWRALGKTEGWEDSRCEQCHDVFPEYHNGCVRCGASIRPDPFNRYHQYRLIDHLADGGTIESYFAAL